MGESSKLSRCRSNDRWIYEGSCENIWYWAVLSISGSARYSLRKLCDGFSFYHPRLKGLGDSSRFSLRDLSCLSLDVLNTCSDISENFPILLAEGKEPDGRMKRSREKTYTLRSQFLHMAIRILPALFVAWYPCFLAICSRTRFSPSVPQLQVDQRGGFVKEWNVGACSDVS